MYAKIATERLVHTYQLEDYVHFRDAMQQDNKVENTGLSVILPSSFTAGPRYMRSNMNDSKMPSDSPSMQDVCCSKK